MPDTVKSSLYVLKHLILTLALKHGDYYNYIHDKCESWDSEVEPAFELRMSGFGPHTLNDYAYSFTVNISSWALICSSTTIPFLLPSYSTYSKSSKYFIKFTFLIHYNLIYTHSYE